MVAVLTAGETHVSPLGVRIHVALIRTLRSYIEGHLFDLVDMNKFEPIVDEGGDDVVEAHIYINGQRFQFHIEGSDQDDETRPCGLLGEWANRHDCEGFERRNHMDENRGVREVREQAMIPHTKCGSFFGSVGLC